MIVLVILLMCSFAYADNNDTPRIMKVYGGPFFKVDGKFIPDYLPNPNLTPGVILNVTKEEVCVKGYAGKVRHVPQSEKKQVYKEYQMDSKQQPCPCEVDHLISLELGGSNDIHNLWPQSYQGESNAHKKDKLENYLHKKVCLGQMSLKEAQDCVSVDWVKCYQLNTPPTEGNKGEIEKNVE